MTDQRSVSSMPGVTLTFVDADGPGDGLRNPVSTVTPSSSMVDFFSGASSPLLQFALQQFTQLDTTNQRITFFAWWRHYWVDPRLA